MYAEFFGLRELPFNVTPDPRFLFLNDCYQEAVAALTYGIQARKGFIALVGEAGTGKTTLLRHLLDSLEPATRSVLLLNPTVSFDEILEHILVELGIPVDGGGKLVRLQRLNEFLIEHTRAGGNVVLMIDEAQDLGRDVLEELRLLSNLETAREKILQIILAGQPELDTLLADPSLRQLRQRVTLRLRLRPLTAAEVATYVGTRLERAGAARPDLFGPEALLRVAVLSEGVPRLVNVLCDATLMLAFAAGADAITPELVDEAWRDYAAETSPAVSPLAPPPATAPGVPPAPAAEVPPAPPLAPPVRPAPAPAVVPPEVAPPPSAPRTGAPPPRAPKLEAAPAAAAPRGRRTGVPVVGALLLVLLGALVVTWRADVSLDSPAGVAAVPATLPHAAPSSAVAAAPPAGARPVEGPVGPLEAAALVEEFRTAYEARDAERLAALFADDAEENGRRGREAIAAGYRERLRALDDVRYAVARVAVEPRGERAQVRAPFVIAYRRVDGEAGEVRGEAEWELERRTGRPLIVALSYRLDPAR